MDNRSAYVRVPGDRGGSTRVECRGADGTANPYLAAALVIFAGLDGIERELDPGPPTAGAYEPAGERETIPFSLEEALDALEADVFVRGKLGAQFLQAFTTIKRNEAPLLARRHRLRASGVRGCALTSRTPPAAPPAARSSGASCVRPSSAPPRRRAPIRPPRGGPDVAIERAVHRQIELSLDVVSGSSAAGCS